MFEHVACNVSRMLRPVPDEVHEGGIVVPVCVLVLCPMVVYGVPVDIIMISIHWKGMLIMAVFGSSPKDSRRFSKAVHRARRDGVLALMDAGEPVTLRARNTDGLHDLISKLAADGGFDVIMVDASRMSVEDMADPALDDVDASLVFYGFGYGDVDGDVLGLVREAVRRRLDGLRDRVSSDDKGVAHAMTMVIVHDHDAPDGMSFSAYDDRDVIR